MLNKGCPEGLYPHQKNTLEKIPSSKPFDQRVLFFANQYQQLLQEYDAILTADIVYQRKGNFLAYNAAMRRAAPNLKAHWYHWIHSGWTHRPGTLNPADPDSLRYTMPDHSTLVYLNSFELNDLAKMYATSPRNCVSIYNPKDFRSFNEFHPKAWEITKRLQFWNKHVIQILPFCSTRMDAKGIDSVIEVFAALKRKGLKVALVLANANGRKAQPEIDAKKAIMAKAGLVDGEDFLWTSDIMEQYRPLPRQAVCDIFKCANVFVWASWRETVGNAFQEAKVSGNLMVLNQNLPACREMGGPDAIWFESSYKTPGVRDGVTGDFQKVSYGDGTEVGTKAYFGEIADHIIARLPPRSHQWQFSFDWIWHAQFKPVLYDRPTDLWKSGIQIPPSVGPAEGGTND